MSVMKKTKNEIFKFKKKALAVVILLNRYFRTVTIF